MINETSRGKTITRQWKRKITVGCEVVYGIVSFLLASLSLIFVMRSGGVYWFDQFTVFRWPSNLHWEFYHHIPVLHENQTIIEELSRRKGLTVF